MKAVLLLLSGLVTAVVVFIGGMAVSAYVIADDEPHRFSHLDTPDLWTAEPVKIDPQKQAYERVPGPVLAADVPASDLPDSMVADRGRASSSVAYVGSAAGAVGPASVADIGPIAIATADEVPVVDTAQADWCFARYRSYRVEDNSYQPYDGGPRRQCEAPGVAAAAGDVTASNGSAIESVQPEPAVMGEVDRDLVQNAAMNGSERGVQVQTAGASVSGDMSGSHADWCSARYRSYRADDNSYQPFDGGPRKACQSPFG